MKTLQNKSFYRTIRVLILTLLFAIFGLSCSSTPDYTKNPDLDELVIATTTDFHASLDQAEGLAQTIRKLRNQYQNRFLYLDAGDIFQGQLEGNLSQGAAQVDLFNLIEVDAMAIGNHELDHGMKNLKSQVERAKYFWLSANMLSSSGHYQNALGQKTLFRPHAIILRGQKKICIIGATTPVTEHITRPKFIRGVKFAPLKEVVEAEAKFSRNELRCKFVVLVVHAGLDCNNRKDFKRGDCQKRSAHSEILTLLEELPRDTLDAVVAGHVHVLAQEVINGTPVIEAGSFGSHVGVLHVFTDSDKNYFDDFIEIPKLDPYSEESTNDISTALQPYREVAEKQKSIVISQTEEPFAKGYQAENALGNLVADAVLAFAQSHAKADFALVNAGGIRASLPQGTIHYGDTYATLPFENEVVVVTLKGRELKTLMEIGQSGAHGAAAVSGLKIVKINTPETTENQEQPWLRDLNQDGKKEDWERKLIFSITTNDGAPILDHQTYRLATIDFLAQGGDHQKFVYSKVSKNKIRTLKNSILRDVFNEYLKSHLKLHGPIKNSDFFDENNRRIITLSTQATQAQ